MGQAICQDPMNSKIPGSDDSEESDHDEHE